MGSLKPLPEQGVDEMVAKDKKDAGARKICQDTRNVVPKKFY